MLGCVLRCVAFCVYCTVVPNGSAMTICLLFLACSFLLEPGSSGGRRWLGRYIHGERSAQPRLGEGPQPRHGRRC